MPEESSDDKRQCHSDNDTEYDNGDKGYPQVPSLGVQLFHLFVHAVYLVHEMGAFHFLNVAAVEKVVFLLQIQIVVLPCLLLVAHLLIQLIVSLIEVHHLVVHLLLPDKVGYLAISSLRHLEIALSGKSLSNFPACAKLTLHADVGNVSR